MIVRNFPPEVNKLVHQLCWNAIQRAKQNGTYKPPVKEESREVQQEVTENNAVIA
ncbi:hypothetical protein ABE137_11230 [Brevibacillus laterosporus]|uniref:hypothetical protein n=1 Tax=Brevibacillus laterosporus TaxID=1465 RepID=UPI003D254E37